MTAERRRAEADALAERVKLEELRRLTAIDSASRPRPKQRLSRALLSRLSLVSGGPVRRAVRTAADYKPRPPAHQRPERPIERPLSFRDPTK